MNQRSAFNPNRSFREDRDWHNLLLIIIIQSELSSSTGGFSRCSRSFLCCGSYDTTASMPGFRAKWNAGVPYETWHRSTGSSGQQSLPSKQISDAASIIYLFAIAPRGVQHMGQNSGVQNSAGTTAATLKTRQATMKRKKNDGKNWVDCFAIGAGRTLNALQFTTT